MARRTKSILKTVEVERARARRTCMNSRAPIQKGQTCIVVWDDPRDRYVYSKAIALRMVEAARQRLDEIERELDGPLTGEEE